MRLVYADYLDEFGNEEDATLARHIREACEEKGLPEVPPLIEAEEFVVNPHPSGISDFKAVIPVERFVDFLGDSPGIFDIITPSDRSNDLRISTIRHQVSSSSSEW